MLDQTSFPVNSLVNHLVSTICNGIANGRFIKPCKNANLNIYTQK